MRTRPPKPVALHIAQGTFRPGRHAAKAKLVGPMLTAIPKPRPSLGKVGKAKWKEISRLLIERKLLQDRFLDALEMLCRAHDRLHRYQTLVDEKGEFYTTAKGFVGPHPAVGLMKAARDEIRRYQIEFGMTPSAANAVPGATEDKQRRVPNRRADVVEVE